MRWFWIDKIVEFETSRRACAIKCITLSEDFIHQHFPGFPVFPPTLMIEGVAQTAGILLGERHAFRENVVLAKVRRAEFSDYGHPGDQLRYDVTLDAIEEQACTVSGVVTKDGAVIGHVDLIMSYVSQSSQAMNLPSHNFVFTPAMTCLLDNVPGARRMERDASADSIPSKTQASEVVKR